MSTGLAAYDFARIRLFVSEALKAGVDIEADASQLHYLANVMRQREGDHILLFNGRDGEWLAEISRAAKRALTLTIKEQTRPQIAPPPLTLLFAPVKKMRLDFMVQKATELGVTAIRPVITQYTNARVKEDRMVANVIEAAEQSGRLDIPEILAEQKLKALITSWQEGAPLLFCDEAEDAAPLVEALKASKAKAPWSILIGPEGGFSPEERAALRAVKDVHPVSLGPRIMRADTAAIAALAVYQAVLGDW